ncbi:MAG: LysR family transcriptional regulator [Candidatus Velthaea sp.]
MELRQLRHFVHLAEELHFGRAAQNAGISQPALSVVIRRMEAGLGVKLFERSKHQVRLTQAGLALLPEAKATIAQAAKAERTAQRAAKSEIGGLVIGILGTATQGRATALIRDFREKRPEVSLNLRFLHSIEQLEALQLREIDLAFTRPFRDKPELDQVVVARESLVVVLPRRHALGRTRVLRVSELELEPFIMFNRDRSPLLFDAVIATCKTAGFSPNIVLHGDEIYSIIALVAAGLGVSIVPESMRRARSSDAIYRQLTPAPPAIELVLAWRKDDASPLVRSFVSEARALR